MKGVGLALLALVTACSTSAPRSGVVAPSSTAGSRVSSTTGAPAMPAVCRISDVTVADSGRDDSSTPAGPHDGTVVLTSTASAPCTLFGFPTVTAVGDDGGRTSVPTYDLAIEPQTVLLQPGGTASFAFRRLTSTGTGCTHVANFAVALPGSADTKPSGSSFTTCGGGGKSEPVDLGPFVAGAAARIGG